VVGSISSWEYTDELGNVKNLEIDAARAAAAGFTAGSSANEEFGKVSRVNRPRGVWLLKSTGQKMFLPFPSHDAWTTAIAAGSVPVSGTTWAITGYQGEQKRRSRYGITP